MSEPHSLAVVVAHTDDDAYGCAGSIALHEKDPGFRFCLVLATDGGAGQIAAGVPTTPLELGAWRRRESANAWRAHGTIPDRHEWLDYADGQVAAADFEELVGRILQVLLEERPQVVATFGPDGITGHRDHIAVGRATDEAFHQARQTPGPGFRRLVHGAMRASTFERWNLMRQRKGLPPWDPTVEYHLRPVPDEWIDIEVDTGLVAHRVVAGLVEHKSQRDVLVGPGMDERRWARMVSRESTVMAWPGRPPGGPLLTDLFEGL
ncbi:MAG: PIG-L family deacetylase [Pseudarthrobacter sp.]